MHLLIVATRFFLKQINELFMNEFNLDRGDQHSASRLAEASMS
jgi:hypothetical protein